MEKDENVHDFISRVEDLHGRLSDIGFDYNESILVCKILAGLPKRFLSFITSFTNMDATKQTLVELIARLGAQELTLNRYRRPVENAFHGEASERNVRDERDKGRYNN